MKKIFNSLLLAMVAALPMLTSCSDDNGSNPTVVQPTEFTINASPLADQYIQLTADNMINLTWSQPNYGFNALATYQIQVGLVENGDVTWNTKDGAPKYLKTTFTTCSADISGEEIAESICDLDGFKDADSYVDKGFREVALRVYSCLYDASEQKIDNSGIVSDNYVTFKHMAAYNAVKSPAYIYLVGNPTGWATPNAGSLETYIPWRLYEKADEIGSDVYYGTFDIPAIDPLQFRFYRELLGWDLTSMGPQEADAGVDCVFKDGSYEGSIMWDKTAFYKGSWNFGAFEGGTISMKVDLKKKTVNFTIIK
ncbi:MAG: SusE domain-containing protein [Prevotella sp.]|nr:SusE domain-containing protein [Prevotella sp.]MBO6186999.1 SusE domain-containing protein [Prevotella sp.]MBQ9655812.1 SusE domain-containing protein [Prevotella sp.]